MDCARIYFQQQFRVTSRLIIKYQPMLEQNMETNVSQVSSESTCEGCNAALERSSQNEELGFAFLLALVPALTLSLFGNIGLL